MKRLIGFNAEKRIRKERRRATRRSWWTVAQPSLCPRRYQKRNFRNASGVRMEHHGERKACCKFAGLSTPVNMLQGSQSRAVRPKEEDNYTSTQAMMRRKGRKFVLDASFKGRLLRATASTATKLRPRATCTARTGISCDPCPSFCTPCSDLCQSQ